MEYDITTANNYKELVELVNMAIKDGWEPIGGLTITQSLKKEFWRQAIIKRKGHKRRVMFRKPIYEEVLIYCKERGNSVSPKAFIDFYESKNWMVGKNKMSDWKAAVRNWESRVVVAKGEPPPPKSVEDILKQEKLPEK